MGIGCRRFIVDDEGRLVRLRNAIFERLLRDPQHHTMPALAGQRVRMAEILVQLADRRPIQVVRRVYFVVGFDEAGRLAAMRFQNQQWALAESAPDRVLAVPSDDNRVLDAASRFIAQGGRWRPSNQLAQHIQSGHSWAPAIGHEPPVVQRPSSRSDQPWGPACVAIQLTAAVSAGKSCSTTSQTAPRSTPR